MKSGIYHIICKKTGRVYVGQSLRIDERWGQHLKSLQSGSHVNALLQEDFVLNGQEGFYFKVREYCNEALLNYAEAQEIDSLLGMGVELYNQMLPDPIRTIAIQELSGWDCDNLYQLCRALGLSPGLVISTALANLAEKKLPHLEEFYCVKTKITNQEKDPTRLQ